MSNMKSKAYILGGNGSQNAIKSMKNRSTHEIVAESDLESHFPPTPGPEKEPETHTSAKEINGIIDEEPEAETPDMMDNLMHDIPDMEEPEPPTYSPDDEPDIPDVEPEFSQDEPGEEPREDPEKENPKETEPKPDNNFDKPKESSNGPSFNFNVEPKASTEPESNDTSDAKCKTNVDDHDVQSEDVNAKEENSSNDDHTAPNMNEQFFQKTEENNTNTFSRDADIEVDTTPIYSKFIMLISKYAKQVAVFAIVFVLMIGIPVLFYKLSGKDANEQPESGLSSMLENKIPTSDTPTTEQNSSKSEFQKWQENGARLGDSYTTNQPTSTQTATEQSTQEIVTETATTENTSSNPDRFKTLDEVTVYIQSASGTILQKEKDLVQNYVDGYIGKDEFLKTMNTYQTANNELSHLLIINCKNYTNAGQSNTYNTLSAVIQDSISYGDKAYNLVSQDTPLTAIYTEMNQ